jgi:hypothetical protein
VAERNETLTTDKSVDEALRAGTQTMESLGLTVAPAGSGALEGKGGNMMMAYFMGLFLPDSAMPVKVTYTVSDSGGSRSIQMHTKSSVPLALYLWKFKHRANAIADGLSQGVSAQLGQSAAPPSVG